MSDLFFFKDDQLIRKAKAQPWKAPSEPKYQDKFEIHYTDAPVAPLHDNDLVRMVGQVLLFDVESFVNFFMVGFRTLDGRVTVLRSDEDRQLDVPKLRFILENYCIIGFNSTEYDVPILQLACTGADCKTLHNATQQIIVDGVRYYDFQKRHKLGQPRWNHVDLIEVAPLRGSLKLYAGRLHTARMQDLPIDPHAVLSPKDKLNIEAYCLNDLVSSYLLFRELESALSLRNEMSVRYSVDLRSKSDAQIAEAVISSELYKRNGDKCGKPKIEPGTMYAYKVPEFISYRTLVMRNMLDVVRNARFVVEDTGYIELPKEIGDLRLALGQCVYKMGIGGLHSTESTVAHTAGDNEILIDRDVVSYYPSIILNQELYPKHLGRAFLDVYRTIVEKRIKAKNEGNKIVADSLKITINGSFGKLGSKWSVLYAPDLMLQVTLTGQLCLLMLIEMVEDLGIPVVSANTDGIVIRCPKERAQELQDRICWWERLTGFQTEETRYKAIYSRDVNNYIAVKADGGFKVKGCYGEKGSAGNSVLSKNPENLICNDAVMALIGQGTPLEETIRGCKDIRRFITMRSVSGGARKSDQYLAKVIRWYYSTEMRGEINRATKGDKIPNSDRARPLMELPAELPTDIDYERYIAVAQGILEDIGYAPKPGRDYKPGFEAAGLFAND